LPFLGLPAASFVADAAQRVNQIVLDEGTGRAFFRRRLGAAERAYESLFRRIPDCLAAARRAGELRQGDGFGGHVAFWASDDHVADHAPGLIGAELEGQVLLTVRAVRKGRTEPQQPEVSTRSG